MCCLEPYQPGSVGVGHECIRKELSTIQIDSYSMLQYRRHLSTSFVMFVIGHFMEAVSGTITAAQPAACCPPHAVDPLLQDNDYNVMIDYIARFLVTVCGKPRKSIHTQFVNVW